jgi:hypothetical protein
MSTIQAWSRVAFAVAVMVSAASGQTADDPGEGLRIETTGTANVRAVKWWGRTGRTYFVQSNPTLNPNTWSYMPVVESGSSAVHSWNLSTTGQRMFVRLVYTDQLYSGSASLADFDGDGLTNAQEVASSGPRSNPLNSDTDDDGFSDSVEWGGGYSPVNGSNNPDYNGGSYKLRANRASIYARHVVSQPVQGVQTFTLKKSYSNIPGFTSQPVQSYPDRPELPPLPTVPLFYAVGFDGWSIFDPYTHNPLASGYHHDLEYDVVEDAEYGYTWGLIRLEANYASTRPRVAWMRLDSTNGGQQYITAILPAGATQTGDFQVQTQPVTNATEEISVNAAGVGQMYIQRDVDVQDGNWTSISGQGTKALPGQRINLRVYVSSVPVGVYYNNFEWTLPDKTFKDYVPTSTTGTLTQMSAGDKQGVSCSFYFADAGSKNIVVNFQINGQPASLNTVIDVQAPIATMDPATTGQMGMVPVAPNGQQNVYYGLIGNASNQHGIDFSGSVQVPQGFEQGQWCYAQVIKTTRTRVTATGAQEKWSLNGKDCVDNSFPYEPPFVTGPATQRVDDSPIDPVPPLQNFTCSNNLTMYMMFKPAGNASRWVALKSITWGFGYSMSLVFGTQDYIPNPAPANQLQAPASPQSVTTQPEWEALIQTGSWGPNIP